jgi:squalene cyclase
VFIVTFTDNFQYPSRFVDTDNERSKEKCLNNRQNIISSDAHIVNSQINMMFLLMQKNVI